MIRAHDQDDSLRLPAWSWFHKDHRFLNRDADRWGAAAFYYDFSNDLEDDLAAIGSDLRDECGPKGFYEAKIMMNLRLDGDVQIIRPGTPGTDTAVFANVRVCFAY